MPAEEMQIPSVPPAEKLQLPVVFQKCPHCGSEKRLGETFINQLKAEGAAHPASFLGGMKLAVPLIDQAHPPAILGSTIKVKVLNIFWDVCECGTMYCTKFECTEESMPVNIQAIPHQPPARGPGQFFRTQR